MLCSTLQKHELGPQTMHECQAAFKYVNGLQRPTGFFPASLMGETSPGLDHTLTTSCLQTPASKTFGKWAKWLRKPWASSPSFSSDAVIDQRCCQGAAHTGWVLRFISCLCSEIVAPSSSHAVLFNNREIVRAPGSRGPEHGCPQELLGYDHSGAWSPGVEEIVSWCCVSEGDKMPRSSFS